MTVDGSDGGAPNRTGATSTTATNSTGEHVPPNRSAMALMIDHTLLAPEATTDEVRQLCAEAEELGCYAICVSPSMLPVATAVRVAAVVGFPSGAHRAAVKAAEAALAAAQGAREIDMVINLGRAFEGDWRAVGHDIACVRQAVPQAVLKVIIESGVLASEERIVAACRAAEDNGAQFVKTSTGFHRTAGGATLEAVRTMRAAVGDRLEVKASGGIRTADVALAMVAAGATRIGTSSSRAILEGLPA